MDDPKRIWTDWKSANDACVAFDEPPARDSEGFRTEYILASEHARLMAEKDEQVEALQARVAEARNAALEDAAKVADHIMRDYAELTYSPHHDKMQNAAKTYCAGEIAAAIRALIEE